MKLLGRIVAGILVLVLLIGLVAGIAGYNITRGQFPQVDGTLQLTGLQSRVEVIRDKFGVPHIYADTPADLFRAQGFVHAQDRFFQMEFFRRIGQGRLAELFGESALKTDRFLRTLDWYGVARQEATMVNAETREMLESYAAGVNAYALNPQNAGRLGLEFRVLSLIGRNWQPEKWEPANSITWIKAMAWDLGANIDVELVRMALLEKGGAALAQAVLPPYPVDAPVIVEGKNTMLREWGHKEAHPTSPPNPLNAFALLREIKATRDLVGMGNAEGIGSNNWVLAGSRTTTGQPILANDPHLGVQMPSIWHQIGLHCRSVSAACPYDVVGVIFPGVPGVVIGHNGRVAWGVTNMEPDTQDLYLEKPNPENPNEFEYNGAFEAAHVREAVINVAGQPSVTITVRSTRHGPILNDPDGAAFADAKHVTQPIALRWPALEPNPMINVLPKMMRAQNAAAFRAALRDWQYASQNFVFADTEGNIGYQATGLIPIRKKGQGAAPVPGWTDEYEWQGYIPFDELPKLSNPPQGLIVTANNAIADAGYPYVTNVDHERGYRARRLQAIFASQEKWSVQDMGRIHDDVYSVHADDVLPALFAAGINDKPESDLSPVLQSLRAWDRRTTIDSISATIFEAFWFELAHQIFADELGKDLAEAALNTNTITKLAVKNALQDLALPFWDDVNTAEREQPNQVIYAALKTATDKLRIRLGRDMQQWQWGKVHTITFRNQTLGKSGVGLIESIFNRGPLPASGTTSAVNAMSNKPDFEVVAHASWRMIVDLGDPKSSLAIHPTGQSGHAFHPHYDDMLPLWLKTQYHPLYWQRSDIEKNTEGKLVLQP